MSNAYNMRGVSATKEEVHAATSKHDKGIFPGAFCRITEDLNGDDNYCSIMHTDDAGTKSTVAYIVYKEKNMPQIFRGLAIDSVVMNLDDMLCVGAADKFVFSNTIGRNAHRIGGDAVAAIIDGYADFCRKMKEYGINITMCGGETSDTGDIVSTVFIDSTFFTRMKKEDVIDAGNIKGGDVIIGFASSGKTVYEDKYNSGMSSNGLTAARHLLLSGIYKEKYPETFSSTIKGEFVYSGKHTIDDMLDGTDITIGEALLSPTRTYAPVLKSVLEKYRKNIHGIIHNTGGGLLKCRNFGENIHYIKDSLFATPPLFEEIYKSGQIERREMYNDFNMGQRLEVYCEEKFAQDIIEIAKGFGVDAKIIGRTELSDGKNKVTIRDKGEEFHY